MVRASEDILATHYARHAAKPFFAGVVAYMSSGPLVALVVEGERSVEGFRSLAGPTNPPPPPRAASAATWDATGERPRSQNLVHGSDSRESAAREIAIWFPELG